MKRTRKALSWTTQAEKNARREAQKDKALLESYWRIYREHENRYYREFL